MRTPRDLARYKHLNEVSSTPAAPQNREGPGLDTYLRSLDPGRMPRPPPSYESTERGLGGWYQRTSLSLPSWTPHSSIRVGESVREQDIADVPRPGSIPGHRVTSEEMGEKEVEGAEGKEIQVAVLIAMPRQPRIPRADPEAASSVSLIKPVDEPHQPIPECQIGITTARVTEAAQQLPV